MQFKVGMLVLAVLVILPLNLSFAQESQQTPPPPCSQPKFSQFDFWVGEWNLTWADSASGTNTITKDYNNCDIIEKFDGRPGSNLTGMSISTYAQKRINGNNFGSMIRADTLILPALFKMVRCICRDHLKIKRVIL